MGAPAMHGARAYAGIERRRHAVVVTCNSEYHCRDGRCLAVRDRRTGQCWPRHRAVGLVLAAGIRCNGDGGVEEVSPPDDLCVGERIRFVSAEDGVEDEVVTSPLVAIHRPVRHVVARYDLCG